MQDDPRDPRSPMLAGDGLRKASLQAVNEMKTLGATARLADAGRKVRGMTASKSVDALRDVVAAAQEVEAGPVDNPPCLDGEQALARIFNAIGRDLSSPHFRTKTSKEASHSFFRQAIRLVPQKDSAFSKKMMSDLIAAGGKLIPGADAIVHSVHAVTSTFAGWNASKEAAEGECLKAREELDTIRSEVRDKADETFRAAVKAGVDLEKQRLREECDVAVAAKEDACEGRVRDSCAAHAGALRVKEAEAAELRGALDAAAAAKDEEVRALTELNDKAQRGLHEATTRAKVAEEASAAAEDGKAAAEAGKAAAEAAVVAAEAATAAAKAAATEAEAGRAAAEAQVAEARARSQEGDAEWTAKAAAFERDAREVAEAHGEALRVKESEATELRHALASAVAAREADSQSMRAAMVDTERGMKEAFELIEAAKRASAAAEAAAAKAEAGKAVAEAQAAEASALSQKGDAELNARAAAFERDARGAAEAHAGALRVKEAEAAELRRALDAAAAAKDEEVRALTELNDKAQRGLHEATTRAKVAEEASAAAEDGKAAAEAGKAAAEAAVVAAEAATAAAKAAATEAEAGRAAAEAQVAEARARSQEGDAEWTAKAAAFERDAREVAEAHGEALRVKESEATELRHALASAVAAREADSQSMRAAIARCEEDAQGLIRAAVDKAGVTVEALAGAETARATEEAARAVAEAAQATAEERAAAARDESRRLTEELANVTEQLARESELACVHEETLAHARAEDERRAQEQAHAVQTQQLAVDAARLETRREVEAEAEAKLQAITATLQAELEQQVDEQRRALLEELRVVAERAEQELDRGMAAAKNIEAAAEEVSQHERREKERAWAHIAELEAKLGSDASRNPAPR